MIRNRIIIALIFIITIIVFISCTTENPIGPAIKQTWGTYDYFSYGLHENWEYIERYPYENDSSDYWLYIFGQEYIKPYTGWQVGILIDGIPTGYYYVNAETSEGVYNCNPYGRVWWLMYKIPFIVGDKWHSETIYMDFYDEEWQRTFDVEVIGREDVSVIADDYEDCVKLKVRLKDSLVDTTSGDSSYYYVREAWYAPNIGLIKWVIIETDVEVWTDASCILKKRYHKRYEGSSSSFLFQDLKRIDHGIGISILDHNVLR